MNPMSIMQLRPMLEQFRERHPRFVEFFGYAGQSMGEDALIEISITDPQGHKTITNMKVSPEDLALFQELRELLH